MSYTADFWHDWLAHGDFPDHPWRQNLERSALTLKGLTYAPTGAMCAAATTSLPETPGGQRNWDYRYSWIRDSAFMLWGLYSLGFDAGGRRLLLLHRGRRRRATSCRSSTASAASATSRSPSSTTSRATSTRSRCASATRAYNQNQHDVWGTLLDSVYIHTKNRDQLPESAWPILARRSSEAIAHWREPDRGIWEVRGEPKHFTSSKVFCWVAFDRGARLARLRSDTQERDALAGGRRRDPRRRARERRRQKRQRLRRSTTAATRSTPRCC